MRPKTFFKKNKQENTRRNTGKNCRIQQIEGKNMKHGNVDTKSENIPGTHVFYTG